MQGQIAGATPLSQLFKYMNNCLQFCIILHYITVGPWLMKLYTTPLSILTLVTWVPQSKLAFGQSPHVGWLSGLRPSAITILQCAASLVAGG